MLDVIRQKEISKPCAVKAGIIHGKRLQEACPGDFSDAHCRGGKGIHRLEPGRAALGSRVRERLFPAFQGWAQLIATHHLGVSSCTLTPWARPRPGRERLLRGTFPVCVREGQDRAHLPRSRLVLGTTRCLLSSWTCPFSKRRGKIFRGKWVLLQNMLWALVPGSHNP